MFNESKQQIIPKRIGGPQSKIENDITKKSSKFKKIRVNLLHQNIIRVTQ